jgi:hypothetical protein
MKTKTVEYYIDLSPGWQDWKDYQPYPCAATNVPSELLAGCVRVRVVVELPCVGGSALASETLNAEVLPVETKV